MIEQMAMLVLAASCKVGGSDCPKGSFCSATWSESTQACPSEGSCIELPVAPTTTFSLPVPTGDAVYCGKKGPGKPEDSHHGCNLSTRFAVDLVSSAFAAPHLVVASADGIAWPVGGCSTKDLTHQDGPDWCNQGWGNYIRVQHEGGVYTQYAHLAALLVDAGKAVKKGDPIGIEGNTGFAGAKHIHWSVHRGTANEGGPSIPFVLATSAGVLPHAALICGNWTSDSKPLPASRYVSENAGSSPPETFEFRAKLKSATATQASCPSAYEELGNGDCLARPTEFKDSRRLIVYFHGMLKPSSVAASAELSELASLANSRGYAVIAMLGEAGLCDWSSESKEHLCFPSGRGQLPRAGEFLQRRFGVALESASRRLGTRIPAPFLMGFSNGGFFVSLLAAETKVHAAGYAVLHGGIPSGVSTFDGSRSRATLLIAAAEDKWQLPKMQALSKAMSKAGWSNELRVRQGFHALQREDVEAVLEFFEETLAKTEAPR